MIQPENGKGMGSGSGRPLPSTHLGDVTEHRSKDDGGPEQHKDGADEKMNRNGANRNNIRENNGANKEERKDDQRRDGYRQEDWAQNGQLGDDYADYRNCKTDGRRLVKNEKYRFSID